MATEHPNLSLVKRAAELILKGKFANAKDLLADDFVWHYFNPRLPDLAGDYSGLSGLEALFQKLAAKTKNTFELEPVSATSFGDELVVTHGRPKLTLEGNRIETDAVVVWRVHDNRISEAWDIPAVYSARSQASAR